MLISILGVVLMVVVVVGDDVGGGDAATLRPYSDWSVHTVTLNVYVFMT